MLMRLRAVWIFVAVIGALNAQTGGRAAGTPQFQSEQDKTDIRLILAEGFETYWNSHQPAAAVTPDKCIDDAVFINTTGGWVKGRENFAGMISGQERVCGSSPYYAFFRSYATGPESPVG
jgi:hypothetical protein